MVALSEKLHLVHFDWCDCFSCSALAIYFSTVVRSLSKSFQLGLLVAYGTTIILIPLLSYCEQKPKAYLTNGIYFYLKKLSLIK